MMRPLAVVKKKKKKKAVRNFSQDGVLYESQIDGQQSGMPPKDDFFYGRFCLGFCTPAHPTRRPVSGVGGAWFLAKIDMLKLLSGAAAPSSAIGWLPSVLEGGG